MVKDELGQIHQRKCKLISFCPLCPEETAKPLRGTFEFVFFTIKENKVIVTEERIKKDENSIAANRHIVKCPKHGLQSPRIKII